ncbi:CynX/NimT family MFS transporter [Mycolicibacterium sp.]|uniref:CynX/NimT family MFS transporter n=1 Tax=Mycolicibacterium sp. TaxID=2320850 RepID=UPI003D0F146B
MLLVSGLVAIALNQRPTIVAAGVLVGELRTDTGIGAAPASLLTTLPLACFGVFALLAPPMGRRLGLDRTLAIALTVLLVGICLRLAPSLAALFIGTAIAGSGIAVTNVLLPSVIKRDFPDRLGSAMGAYSVLLSGGAALASVATIPMGEILGTGWRTTLAVWGVLVVVALGLWLPRTFRRQHAADHTEMYPPAGIWRSPLAWSVAGFMALQSLVYFALIAWLPALLHDSGLTQARAGFMSAVMGAVGIVASFVVPVLASKTTSQRSLVVVTAGTFAAGVAGLLWEPAAGVWLWMVLLGIGQGAGIGLVLTLFALRTTDSAMAAELSGMAQAVGYLVAATGPTIIGVQHEVSGSWTLPLVTLIVVVGGLLVSGWFAAANRTVQRRSPERS